MQNSCFCIYRYGKIVSQLVEYHKIVIKLYVKKFESIFNHFFGAYFLLNDQKRDPILVYKWLLNFTHNVSQNVVFTRCKINIFSQKYCDLLVGMDCASIQMRMLSILHSYLSHNEKESFAKWHETLFHNGIKYSSLLSKYILHEDTLDVAMVSLPHKQMLLAIINSNQKIFSVLMTGVKINNEFIKYGVSTVCNYVVCAYD